MRSRNASFAMTRIVLDTNAVLDLLLWHNAELDCVARALAAGPAQLVCDEACLRELRTVLRYPKFGLDDAQEIEVASPFGAPSAAVTTGTLAGVRFTFLPRHGPGLRDG